MRTLVVLVVLFASMFPINFVPHIQDLPARAHGQLSGKQGEVLVFTLPVTGEPDRVIGHLLKREILFFPIGGEKYAGLLGLDMQDQPGQYELEVQVQYPDWTDRHKVTVLLMKEDFKVQHLKLPKKMVDLDKKTLARVKRESKVLYESFESVLPTPLWNSEFIEPLKGRISGRFGSRRIINGKPKRPHSGEDIAAPTGTTVVAINSGMVRLTICLLYTSPSPRDRG